jgi:hypothetical protein
LAILINKFLLKKNYPLKWLDEFKVQCNQI